MRDISRRYIILIESSDYSTPDLLIDYNYCCGWVVGQERAVGGWDYGKFISHSKLGYNAATNCQYLMNNCFRFRFSIHCEQL